MQIEENKRTREVLKGYFVKNAIPTEGQFAELIASSLNQRDDRVVKEPNGPLSLEGAGDATGLLKTLSFYFDFADADPAWTIALKPRTTLSDPSTARPGFSVNDPAGNSRLFIDSSNGNVGVGEIRPTEKLQVNGRVRALGVSLLIDQDLRPTDRVNLVRFGSTGDYQILHKAQGFWNKPTLALHCEASDAIGFYTSGWRPLLEAEGTTGNVRIGGALHLGNSDLYFANTNHNHTGIGNQAGWAAIENAANLGSSGSLALLGRQTTDKGRVVGVWDLLQVWGRLEVSDTITSRGLIFEADRPHIDRDGALYRSGGQVFLTVDDNLYIRRSGAAATIQMTVAQGKLALAINQDLRATSDNNQALNLIRFGSTGDYQVLHAFRGHFNKPTLAFHCEWNDSIGFYTTGWTPNLEVEGNTGNVWARGFVIAQGTGGEQCYLGGDGAGGDVQIGSMNGNVMTVAAWNTVKGFMKVGALDFVKTSDGTLKSNVANVTDALDKLQKVRGVTFDWKSDAVEEAAPATGKNLGLIAQEVQQVFPELVSESRGFLHVSYTGLVPVLVEAVKELNERIARMEGAAK